MVAGIPFPRDHALLPASEWGPSSVTLAHVHFIVLKLCNSAALIYEGCISSSDPCWYRTHYFPFMCLCQRATGNQLLETDVKKKKKPTQQNPLLSLWYYFKCQYLLIVSLGRAMDTVAAGWLCQCCEEIKMISLNFQLRQATRVGEQKHIPTTKQNFFRLWTCFLSSLFTQRPYDIHISSS